MRGRIRSSRANETSPLHNSSPCCWRRSNRGPNPSQRALQVLAKTAIDANRPSATADRATTNAAETLESVPLDQLRGLKAIFAWSRAQMIKGNYNAAAEGYAKTLAVNPSEPKLQLEAAAAAFKAEASPVDTPPRRLRRFRLLGGADGAVPGRPPSHSNAGIPSR